MTWDAPPPRISPGSIQMKNWFLLSNVSMLHTQSPGLIHSEREVLEECPECPDAVAFRGYILTPPIHSFSSSKAILRYWLSDYPMEHNGVFATTCIRDSGSTLELISDAFGMCPLYYREFEGMILFATNARYLTAEYDEPDYMAWRCLIQSGFIAADRTLSSAIKRVPAGYIVRFHEGKAEQQQWFDYGTLPEGRHGVDRKTFEKVEQAFQQAMSRCLRLKATANFLPVSSGYDSRRLLVGLLDQKAPFETATVRVFQKGYRDLDARFATLMAKELDFPHYVVERRTSWEYASDDYIRRILVDAETPLHTWAVILMQSLPEYPTLLFDGLAGDVLGNAEFIIPGRLPSGVYESPDTDRELFVNRTITNDYDAIFHPGKWPSADDVRRELMAYVETLPSIMNQATLAKLLLRTRRSIAPWTQHMLQAGHIAVYPFLDLDYVRTTLMYHPADKHRTPLQKACLEKYWPQYFQYPGSKAIPPDMPQGSPEHENERHLACLHQLQQELRKQGGLAVLTQLLTRKANLRFQLSLKNDRMALMSMWAFRQLMELVAHSTGKITCWKFLHGTQETH